MEYLNWNIEKLNYKVLTLKEQLGVGGLLVPALLLDDLIGGEDPELSDGGGGHLTEPHPPPQLCKESQPQLRNSPQETEGKPEDPGHSLLQGVAQPVAGDGEGDHQTSHLLEVSRLVGSEGEVSEVELDQLLRAEQEAGG